jgi:hypothetical protein
MILVVRVLPIDKQWSKASQHFYQTILRHVPALRTVYQHGSTYAKIETFYDHFIEYCN